MRITGFLALLLLVGLAFGSTSARAEPCPYHPHDRAGAQHDTVAAGWQAIDDGRAAIAGEAARKYPPSSLGDAAALGHPCCHVTGAFIPTTGPGHVMRLPAGRLLPPREAPGPYGAMINDIFRPPALT